MTVQQGQLEAILRQLRDVVVAVSGGVDSLTLAALAQRTLGAGHVAMAHAVSPAVPAEATARVRDWALREGWRLDVIDAGEFADPQYRANPVNRCFFCKHNLYGAIRAHKDGQIVSGANLDDLGEYRPGLDAAREHGVRHPYVEAGLAKTAVRALARELGLGDVADLPAAPCLSSRIETGIRIEPETLDVIHAIERLVSAILKPHTVRCRVRATGVVVELDPGSLERLSVLEAASLRARIAAELKPKLAGSTISFARYRTGSAFLRESA